MVSVPVERHWTMRPLAEGDVDDALAFLRRDPLVNVYLMSRIIEERSAPSSQIVQVFRDGELILLSTLATNIVLAADPNVPQAVTDEAVAIIAERILTRMVPVRAIISPLRLVEALWRRLEARLDPPTVVRLNQPIYAIAPRPGFPALSRARYATTRDLDRLVPACAAMHLEEVGIDPMQRDAVGYRDRIRELVERKRSVVLTEGPAIAAKCEFAAVTPDAAQLMGVWTAPAMRRKGFARVLLREVCGELFQSGRKVTLFVNDFNAPAIALYESLGFRRIGMNRALIW